MALAFVLIHLLYILCRVKNRCACVDLTRLEKTIGTDNVQVLTSRVGRSEGCIHSFIHFFSIRLSFMFVFSLRLVKCYHNRRTALDLSIHTITNVLCCLKPTVSVYKVP